MNINLYTGILEIRGCKGICTITAYDEKQAKELAINFWEGYKDYNGKINISQISGINCECNVLTSLKILNGNTLEEILSMEKTEEQQKDKYIIGDYLFDTMRQTLTYKDGEVETLTTKENDLLCLLCKISNKIVDRNILLEKVWGESTYYTSRSMDVYITKMRKHLIKDERIEILNVHGKGFKFIVPEN